MFPLHLRLRAYTLFSFSHRNVWGHRGREWGHVLPLTCSVHLGKRWNCLCPGSFSSVKYDPVKSLPFESHLTSSFTPYSILQYRPPSRPTSVGRQGGHEVVTKACILEGISVPFLLKYKYTFLYFPLKREPFESFSIHNKEIYLISIHTFNI